MSDMPDRSEHDPALDLLLPGPGDFPVEPPAAFMAAVRRRHRRAVLHRTAAIVITTCIIAMIALGLALPALRSAGPRPLPIVTNPRPAHVNAPEVVPTAATLRRFIDDPAVLDASVPSGPGGHPVRAGDRPESDAVRPLLTVN